MIHPSVVMSSIFGVSIWLVTVVLFLGLGAVLPTASAQTLTVTNLTSSYGCQSVSTFALNDCSPASSTITVTGSGFLSPLVVTVAGLPCRLFNAMLGGTTFGAFLPAPEGFVPGLGYDLVITSGSINVTTLTLPGAIAFTVRPAITSVTSQFCPKDWVDTTNNRLYCSGGDVLTIIGSFFSPSASLSVQLIAASNSRLGLVIPCPNVNLVSVSTLTCTLPTITNSTVLSAFQSYVSQVQVYENATSYSNVYAVNIYIGAYNPQLFSVTGCAGPDASTRGAQGCTTGASITLTGANFNQSKNRCTERMGCSSMNSKRGSPTPVRRWR